MLELPATGWLRRYRVRALGRVMQDALDRLRGGITVEGVRYGPIEATLDREQGANVWLTFGIREGKNREVRKVLETLGLKVNRLIRVAFGPFELGDLDDGAVREIETEKLRETLGQTSQPRQMRISLRRSRNPSKIKFAERPDHPPRRDAARPPSPASGTRKMSGHHIGAGKNASATAATVPAVRDRHRPRPK